MVEIYQYAAQELKHLPQMSLHDIRETRLYEKKPVNLNGNRDRRSNSSTTRADRTDANLGEKVTDFLGLIRRKIYYRILLGFSTSLGLGNFPHEIHKRLKQTQNLTAYQTNQMQRSSFMIHRTSLINK